MPNDFKIYDYRGVPYEKRHNQVMKNAAQLISGNIVSRATLAATLGQQYGTDRDLYEALGYPTSINYDDYASRYTRQDIAKAVIDKPVNATWRGGFRIVESDDDKETELERVWQELDAQHSLTYRFQRVDKLTGLGMYGVLLLGLDDIQQKEYFQNPVEGKRQLTYVKALGEGAAEIHSYVEDSSDPRYGLPKLYDVTITHPDESTTSSILVHHSRIIHIADGLLESEVLGVPRLQCIYNRLMDLEKLTGGSAEMFWRGARPGYQGKVDPDYHMTSDDKEDLQDQIDEYEHYLRRILINSGVELKALEPQVANPEKHVDIQIQMISAVTGIPKRILTGSERGELASTQDRENWLSMIGGRRTEFADPCIVRPFVNRCMEYGILPPAKEYSIEWQPLFEESDKDKAEVGKIRSQAVKEYATNPQAETIIPPDAFYRFMLGLSQDQIDLIQEMQDAAINEDGM